MILKNHLFLDFMVTTHFWPPFSTIPQESSGRFFQHSDLLQYLVLGNFNQASEELQVGRIF